MSSEVVEEVCLTPQSRHDRHALQKCRENVLALLCSLYCLVLVVLGIAFPLTYFVSGGHRNSGLYLSIFHIYIYLASLVFLIYVHFTIAYHKRQLRNETSAPRTKSGGNTTDIHENGTLPLENKETRVILNYKKNDMHATDWKSTCPEPQPGQDDAEHTSQPAPLRRRGTFGTIERLTQDGTDLDDLPFYFAQEGVNFFLRLSAIGFAMCSIVLDGFRLVQFAQTDYAWECYGLLFVVHTALRLVYVFCLSFFIFKNHRVVLNFHKCLMKLGLLHILATNLCVWSITVALETSESYSHLNTEMLNNTGTAMKEAQREPIVCHTDKSLADKASSFLYPCVVQFCLISAAVLFRIFSNIGAPPYTSGSTLEDKARPGLECQKSTSGLFLGLFVLTLSTIGVCFFLLYKSNNNPFTSEATAVVYFISDIMINLMAAGGTAVAFWKTKQLGFMDDLDLKFNTCIVLFGLGGFYTLIVFLIVPSISSVHTAGVDGIVSKCFTALCIISFCQGTVQVLFMLDGLRRRSTQRAHYKMKPGRSLVTFLMICNFSLWLINTFQLKEAHTAPTFTSFYGSLPWLIILHISFPLAIFYRFYSTISLSEIWSESYSRRSQPNFGY